LLRSRPRQTRRLIFSSAILVLAYIPWLVQVARAYAANRLSQNIGWIPRPGLRALIEYVMLLNQPFVFAQSSADNRLNIFGLVMVVLIFGVPVIVCLWRSFGPQEKRDRRIIVLGLLAFAPASLVGLFSWLWPHSVWGARHLMIAAVPYAVLAALAITRFQPYRARVTVFLIGGCWLGATAGYVLIRPVPHFTWCTWQPLVEKVGRNGSSQTNSFYAFEDLVAYHLWFTLKDSPNQSHRVSVIKGVPGLNEDAAFFLPRDFDEISV